MLRRRAALLIAPAIVLGLLGVAFAEKTVTVVDDVNLPARIELAVGDAVEFYAAERGSRMRFTKPGTYRYTVHVIGRRPHTHTGTVVVR